MKFWWPLIVTIALSPMAQAADLKVVSVGAPAVWCIFNAGCTITGEDSVGNLTYTPLGDGARLQTSTFPGAAGTPGAGKTGYLYRVDLTKGAGFTECTAGVTLNFGPITPLPYTPNTSADMFVVTSGGLGSIGVKSAVQTGDVVTVTFDKYLCAGATSFFFGLASAKPPVAGVATLHGIGNPPIISTAARLPQP